MVDPPAFFVSGGCVSLNCVLYRNKAIWVKARYENVQLAQSAVTEKKHPAYTVCVKFGIPVFDS